MAEAIARYLALLFDELLIYDNGSTEATFAGSSLGAGGWMRRPCSNGATCQARHRNRSVMRVAGIL